MKAKFQQIVDYLKKEEAQINMSQYIEFTSDNSIRYVNESNVLDKIKQKELNLCNTVGCIAGIACLLNPELVDSEESFLSNGSNILGLSYSEGEYLFLGRWSEKILSHITKQEIIEYLEATYIY